MVTDSDHIDENIPKLKEKPNSGVRLLCYSPAAPSRNIRKHSQRLFIREEVFPASEKTFRQVYKRDLAFLRNSMKSYLAFI